MKRIVLLLLILKAACMSAQTNASDLDSKYATDLIKPGVSIPDFKLRDNNGKWQKISKVVKGKYSVIDFWASWCPDCRKDMPNIKRMVEKFSPMGVQFLGISFDNEPDDWKAAIEKYNILYPQLSELKRMRESDVAQAFGVKWIPSMLLVDKEGRVMLGTVLSDKMEVALTELMAKEQPVIMKGQTERVTIDGAKGKLQAIIQKPELAQGQTCPMVMLCHGFSGRKDGPMFELIADSLMQHGIASIRFDFNGHGESEGDFVDMTVPNEIEDAQKVYEYVRDLRYVDGIAIVGHSQGGVVASMVAGKGEEGDFQAVVLMAPAAVLRDDAIRGSTMGKTYDPLDPPDFVELYGGLRLGREYIKTAFSLPIYETAAGYKGPALIVHGTGDRVVPYTYGERYHQIWNGSQLVLLEAYDHGFSQNIYRVTQLVSDYLIKVFKGR
ncbi:MAG: alpha/beta fold hydrolase [Prevotella sp.]|nr:alpha/beta fold hydrolase [Prevotella sp.]